MKTYLVAVVAPSEDDVMEFLLASPLGPGNSLDAPIDCWWIAEDDRHDRSDCDSAIFVPRGAQADCSNLVSSWCDAMSDEWDETGYPYPDDVSGIWYSPRPADPALDDQADVPNDQYTCAPCQKYGEHGDIVLGRCLCCGVKVKVS